MAIKVARRKFIAALGRAVVAWPLAAHAQQSDRMRLIGVLMPSVEGDPESQVRINSFQQGLEKLGWMIGRNIRIEIRWSLNDVAKIQAAIAYLLAMGPDVILALTSRAVATLQQATRAVPIVFVAGL